MTDPALNIEDLSPDDRLRLLEQIWESLRKGEESIPLSDAQRDELDHRLHEIEKDGGHGIPWDEVLRRIQGRRSWKFSSGQLRLRTSKMPIAGTKNSGRIWGTSSLKS